MRTLAIDCATPACSLALFEGEELLAYSHEVLGRGHAERLVPKIAELPEQGRADRILVSLGPGSFTGVRIGLACARALGLAWGADVLGYPTLALIAAMARAEQSGAVFVSMTGGHGEWFVQDFAADGTPVDAVRSLSPQSAAAVCQRDLAAGSTALALAETAGRELRALDLLPDARFALNLPPTLLTQDLSPVYGRAPDAKLPGVST